MQASSVHSSHGVTDDQLSIDNSLNTFAALEDFNDKLVIDLGNNRVSQQLQISWRRSSLYTSDQTSHLVVKQSADGLNYIPLSSSLTSSSSELMNSHMSLKPSARYIMITVASPIDDAIEVAEVILVSQEAKQKDLKEESRVQKETLPSNNHRVVKSDLTKESQLNSDIEPSNSSKRVVEQNSESLDCESHSAYSLVDRPMAIATLRHRIFVLDRKKNSHINTKWQTTSQSWSLEPEACQTENELSHLSGNKEVFTSSLNIRPPPS